MALAAVEALLSRKIGLDPASVGSGAIARCVRHRMSERGLADPDAYAGLLQASEAELEELAEEVIVPETWFFRDREPFRLLGQCAVSEWLTANRGGVFRALSIPCSTGEEPYSVAMTLLDAGLAPGGFHVDAVDLSKRALSAARRAVYGRNSFRGEDLSFRDGHFERTEEGWRLLPPARTSVQFVQGNLLNSPFLLTAAPYDAILCRNLLIYFGREARERTIRVLDGLLKPSGLLLVGHAESPQLWGERFVPMRHPGAFACRKRDERQVAGPGSKPGHGSRVKTRSRVQGQNQVTGPESKPLISDSGLLTLDSGLRGADDAERPSLEVVARLADEGRLEEAAALCESYLRENSPQARAFFLLGLIHQASGDDQQAETYFNRAVYLEPDHEEALVHLALLAERRGDRAGAARFRQRYQRVQIRSER